MIWVVYVVLLVIFLAALWYFMSLRSSVAFNTRSPKLVISSVIFLMLDALGNTFIYSGMNNYKNWKWKCAMSSLVQQFVFVVIVAVVYLRMYRIYKVYSSYNQYLQD